MQSVKFADSHIEGLYSAITRPSLHVTSVVDRSSKWVIDIQSLLRHESKKTWMSKLKRKSLPNLTASPQKTSTFPPKEKKRI